jgi:mannose-1-phosphate guanylyltransferase
MKGVLVMKVVILAGGEGERIRPLTLTKPKSMLYVGKDPLIHHLVAHLAKQGFDEIITTVGYLKEQIISYLGNGRRYGVSITHVYEGTKSMGTAGSVKLAKDLLEEPFLVVQGDAVTNVDLVMFMNQHRESGGMVSIGLKEVADPSLYGVALLRSDGSVEELIERPKEAPSKLASAGIYIIEPSVLDEIPDGKPYDFARDLFPAILSRTAPVFGFFLDGFWTDAGEKEGYLQANRWYLANMSRSISAESTIKGEVRGNVHVGKNVMIDSNSSVANPSVIDEGVRIERGARLGPDAVIIKNSKVGSGTRILSSVVYEECEVHDNAMIESSIIAEKCFIGEGAEIRESMLGAGCRIEKGAKVMPESVLYPNVVVKAGKVVKGIVRP